MANKYPWKHFSFIYFFLIHQGWGEKKKKKLVAHRLQILWCNYTDNHPQEELAKFGYKLEIFKNYIIYLATYWNLLSSTRRHNSWILRARHPPSSFVCPSVRKLWENESDNDARHTPICFRWSYCQNCKHAQETKLSPQ